MVSDLLLLIKFVVRTCKILLFLKTTEKLSLRKENIFHQNQVSETSKSFVFLIRPYPRIFLFWHLCVCLIIVKKSRCYFLVNVGLIALKAFYWTVVNGS